MNSPATPALVFRPMDKNEATEIATLICDVNEIRRGMKFNSAGREDFVKSWSGMLERFCSQSDSTVLLAEHPETNQRLGVIGWEKLDNGNLNLEHLYSTCAGLHIGTSLMKIMFNMAEKPCEINVLSAESSLGFYRNMGFVHQQNKPKTYQVLSSYRTHLWQICPPDMKPVFPEEKYVPVISRP